MTSDKFDQLSQDYRLLSNLLAEMGAGAVIDDPALLDELVELSEANRNLKSRLSELKRAQAGHRPIGKNKPALRLVE